ncbi:hypothetical protein C8F01DRAFT_987598 [Mycena amicta]|nr:hypothetical protein C8F01DRAFT_987598 [Mycena amicta]
MPRRTHANSRPLRTTGTVLLAQDGEVSAYFPGHSPRKSPSKKSTTTATSHTLPESALPDFHSLNDDLPGPGSRKRVAQYDNWMKIMPEVVRAYMELLVETRSLRETANLPVNEGATCGCQKRVLTITVIRWQAIEDIVLRVCNCLGSTAPVLLLRAGLFACSPCNPTLAVDVQLLDFVLELSLNVAPNNTAFCKTLESYLARRDYRLGSGVRIPALTLSAILNLLFQERLRIRFGNALQWFTHVVQLSHKSIHDALAPARTQVRDRAANAALDVDRENHDSDDLDSANHDSDDHGSDDHDSDDPAGDDEPSNATGQKRRHPVVEEEDEPPANPFPEPPPRSRPSDYLVERCPTCFTGLEHDHSQVFDLAVAMDACFTQKRRRRSGGEDPPRRHPFSVFMDRSKAREMEAYVDGVRCANPPAKKSHTEPDGDGFDGDMKVPKSSLDACGASFKAANESREKASTKFFAQTGLMGLVCRHDIVLFFVNMESAGEKQYYVFLLLEELFQHLPKKIKVGALYDIACQTHRSCVLWGFLDRYKDRLVWAVSVFHAFAHIWGCQLIYHPQKCLGFGGSNGENSERVWAKLSHLIAVLRVSGYHQRNYTIDMQTERDSKEVVRGIAAWICQRLTVTQRKYREADDFLRNCGRTDAEIQVELDKQIVYQTRPLTKRSKTQAYKAINSVLAADRTISLLETQTASLTRQLCARGITVEQKLSLQESLQEFQDHLTKERKARDKLIDQLGHSDRTSLKDLKYRDYYSARLGARTLKERILERLTQRKMELDPIERSVRRTRSEEKKNTHASAAIKKREPTIKKLVKSFNDEQAKIMKLMKQNKVPENTRAPERLSEEHIFELDIDDSIWSDIGLGDHEESEIPQALLDPEVREQIRYFNQKKRAEEELHRLQREHGHLRAHLACEWEAIETTIAGCTDATLLYHLRRQRRDLLELHVLWKASLDAVPCPPNAPPFQPTEAQLTQARVARDIPAWRVVDDDQASDVCTDDGEPEDEEDPAIISVLSSIELADNRPIDGDDDDVFI